MNLILHLFMNVLVLLIRKKKYKIYIVQNASVCFSDGIEHTRSRQAYETCRRQKGPRREKTCLRGFRQSEFQTGLLRD